MVIGGFGSQKSGDREGRAGVSIIKIEKGGLGEGGREMPARPFDLLNSNDLVINQSVYLR